MGHTATFTFPSSATHGFDYDINGDVHVYGKVSYSIKPASSAPQTLILAAFDPEVMGEVEVGAGQRSLKRYEVNLKIELEFVCNWESFHCLSLFQRDCKCI